MYFRNLVLSAFVIAIVAGVIFSGYQYFYVTPLIIGSEVYEVIEPVSSHAIVEEAWSPETELERHSWSFLSNFLLCFAYALMLLSVMSIKENINILKGLFWGVAAYLTVFVAPALGLPPEIPGMEASYLEGRQFWWMMTLICTGFSLWIIAFKALFYKGLAVVLITVPYIFGAPQPEAHGFMNTDPVAIENLTHLWHQFILHSSIANALLWIVIGVMAGYLINKFINPLDDTYKND